ncbi:MAG TPA: beta/gamma crystallin-related protein [Anaerolineae bacterium]|nr:beta/gamma crystallin-related protein [Anaerolineae bacterium]HOR01319.1 beta/gamma crystallin-related protein [Anaerolineae bacterium]HPL29580.1 beta/gamma crystallin-related protein [Anaerolineae bacterium]
MVKKSKRLLVVLLLALSIISLLALDRRPVWGDPSQRVWYYGALVPFSVLLDNGIVPHCHDGLGPGNLTCYSTNEELSAATGVDLADVDRATVERLRSTGAVTVVPASYYAVLWEHVGFRGRNVILSGDYYDLGTVLFDNITSSIEVPDGAGYSTYYAYRNYGGISYVFDQSIRDLRTCGLNDMISSAPWPVQKQ